MRKKFTAVLAVALALTMIITSVSISAATRPGRVKITSAATTSSSVTLRWNKVSNADGYAVFRIDGEKTVLIKTQTARKITINGLADFEKLKFAVKAFERENGKKIFGRMSVPKLVQTKAIPVSGVKITAEAVNSGSAATLICTVAGGTQPYAYQWFKSGVAIEGATSDRFTTPTLYAGVTQDKYTCQVTNPAVKPGDTSAGAVKPAEAAAPAVEVKPVYVPITPTAPSREVIKSWNIGYSAASQSYYYNGTNGQPNVTATLYKDGELAINGNGYVLLFDDPLTSYNKSAQLPPWTAPEYREKILTTSIDETVEPASMSCWYMNCYNLTEAPDIPDTVQLMDKTFMGCRSLVKPPATIPESVLSFYCTFCYCPKLSGTMMIESTSKFTGGIFDPSSCFTDTSTAVGTSLVLKYTSASQQTVQTLFNQKSNNSNIVMAGAPVIPALKLTGLTVIQGAPIIVNAIIGSSSSSSQVSFEWYVKKPGETSYTSVTGAFGPPVLPLSQSANLSDGGTRVKCVMTVGTDKYTAYGTVLVN